MQAENWIASSCGGDYCYCSIKVKRDGKVATRIEGNKDSPVGAGRLCPKGLSGLMLLYDPSRVNYPVKRGNPAKGINVDPQWQRISWDEALDTITAKLKEAMQKDPRSIFFQTTTTHTHEARANFGSFRAAIGSPNWWVAGGAIHCGLGAHFAGGLYHASWSLVPDFKYCNYVIYWGVSKGHGAGHASNTNMGQAADARARGMKAKVFDPFMSAQASVGDEWIPIKVGTDGIVALAMVNVLLNDLGIYDAEYLKKKTNGPYLINPQGYYMVDPETKKPLVWDPTDKQAKMFDDPTIKDFALLGTFDVDGTTCTPSFQLLKEHVKKYTPEEAEKVSTVPAKTIRRIAKEFGEEARIGSTITIDGKVLPYRPAASIYFRGSQGHANSAWTCVAMELLNEIVGSADLPGGALGFPPTSYGHPDTGSPYYAPHPAPDGLMISGSWMYAHKPYPLNTPRKPDSLHLKEMFPSEYYNPYGLLGDRNEEFWEKTQLGYRPEVMVAFGCNSIMTMTNPEQIWKNFLGRFKFTVAFEVYQTEFTDAMADIVLPDGCYLERLFPAPIMGIFNHPAGLGNWGWAIVQPVVDPLYERRDHMNVLLELAERLDIRAKFYKSIQTAYETQWGVKFPNEYALDASTRLTWEEISDRLLKASFGPERGLEWFKQNGVLTWPKRVEEVYWRNYLNVRVPIYFEFFKEGGRKAKELAESYGLGDMLDWDRYTTLPSYHPCQSHILKDPEYDLYGFYFRSVLHTNSFTNQNAWLDEVSVADPYVYNVQIHRDTAAKKGISDGDTITIENSNGRKVKGRAKLVDGIHREHIAVAACAGHWTPNQPVAKGKGVFYNNLLEVKKEFMDPISFNQDICVKVKVYKE